MTRALRHEPTHAMIAASATADEIVFVQEETSADGERRGTVHRMRVTMSDPAVRGAWSHGLAEPRPRDLAWARNPECCECRTRITSPSECGLIETPDGPRVACKGNGCLVRAISRIHPDIQTAAAARRAGGR
jgi:hypothetical protein